MLSLWNVHYRVHKSPPLDPILSQPNPVRPIDSYLPTVHQKDTLTLQKHLPKHERTLATLIFSSKKLTN